MSQWQEDMKAVEVALFVRSRAILPRDEVKTGDVLWRVLGEAFSPGPTETIRGAGQKGFHDGRGRLRAVEENVADVKVGKWDDLIRKARTWTVA